jgi:hypothetical protein
LEMLFQGQMVPASSNSKSALSGGVIRNAQAGPGPRSTAAAAAGMSAAEANKEKVDRDRDTPGPSVPPTPTPNQAVPNGLPNGSSAMPNGGGTGTGSTARPGAPDRPPPSDLERIQLRPHPQPGPGGIILRPSRTLGLSGLGGISGTNPLAASGTVSLFNSNSKDYDGYATGSNRKEMILRELEARKLYKVVDGRPVPIAMGGVVGMPMQMQMQAGGMGMPGAGPGQALMGHASAVPPGGLALQDDITAPGPGAGPAPGSIATAAGMPALPLPQHGPNYWPYVDPASIFKDILG